MGDLSFPRSTWFRLSTRRTLENPEGKRYDLIPRKSKGRDRREFTES